MYVSYQSQQDALKAYIPSLDGLRGIAIIWVMLHNGALYPALTMHSTTQKVTILILNTGWMGVQIFFVLSGFLITGILIDAKRNELPNVYRQFYMRRVLRIFPVYYIFLILAFITAVTLTDSPSWLQNAYEHKWWYIFYVNNWIQPFQDVGFSHFWSLAIEEQFYFFWPIAVISLSFSRLYIACLLLVTTSLVFRFAVTAYDLEFAASGAYEMTLARCDALAIGSLLAIMLRDRVMFLWTHKIIPIIMTLSAIYIMFALFTQHSFPPVSSGWTTMNQTIAALFFVALLYYSLNLNNPENKKGFHMRLLSLTWLRSIGKYSYAMYIFHLPVTLLLHTYLSKPLISDLPYISEDKKIAVFIIDLVCLFVSTYLLAWLSWRLIESKFLHFKRYFPMQKQKYI